MRTGTLADAFEQRDGAGRDQRPFQVGTATPTRKLRSPLRLPTYRNDVDQPHFQWSWLEDTEGEKIDEAHRHNVFPLINKNDAVPGTVDTANSATVMSPTTTECP